jgi:hypothetical protein
MSVVEPASVPGSRIPTQSATPGNEAAPPQRRARRRLSLGWEPPQQVDRAGWITLGASLAEFGRVNNWWVGDWIRYGTTRWGERYVEASKITGLDSKTLRNIAYVAGRFDLSRRRDKLTWTHHAEVAALDHEQQEKWLDRAVDLRLSPADLRLEVRTAMRSPDRAQTLNERSSGILTCPKCGFEIPENQRRSTA